MPTYQHQQKPPQKDWIFALKNYCWPPPEMAIGERKIVCVIGSSDFFCLFFLLRLWFAHRFFAQILCFTFIMIFGDCWCCLSFIANMILHGKHFASIRMKHIKYWANVKNMYESTIVQYQFIVFTSLCFFVCIFYVHQAMGLWCAIVPNKTFYIFIYCSMCKLWARI